jgi:hypothetical protein
MQPKIDDLAFSTVGYPPGMCGFYLRGTVPAALGARILEVISEDEARRAKEIAAADAT